MRILLSITTLSLAAACVAAQPAPESLWRYVHPEAKLIAGLEWAKAKQSPVGKILTNALPAKGGISKVEFSQGMEFLESLDRFILSSPSMEGLGESDQPPALLIAMQGKIDRAVLKKSLPDGTAVERFKGVDLYVPPAGKKSEEMLLAVVSDTLALAGDRTSIATALDSPGAPLDQQLMERAVHLAANCEFWLVSNTVPGMASPDAPQALRQLEDMESLDMGVFLAKGLGLDMSMKMKTVESAQGMSMMTQLMMGMMAGQAGSPQSELARAMKGLKVTQQGTQVRVALDIPTSTLQRGVLQARQSFEQAGRRTLESILSGQSVSLASAQPQRSIAPEPPLPPPAPRTPVKKTIRIVGLESGDREISYERR
jgi:hypothetical protein